MKLFKTYNIAVFMITALVLLLSSCGSDPGYNPRNGDPASQSRTTGFGTFQGDAANKSGLSIITFHDGTILHCVTVTDTNTGIAISCIETTNDEESP